MCISVCVCTWARESACVCKIVYQYQVHYTANVGGDYCGGEHVSSGMTTSPKYLAILYRCKNSALPHLYNQFAQVKDQTVQSRL